MDPRNGCYKDSLASACDLKKGASTEKIRKLIAAAVETNNHFSLADIALAIRFINIHINLKNILRINNSTAQEVLLQMENENLLYIPASNDEDAGVWEEVLEEVLVYLRLINITRSSVSDELPSNRQDILTRNNSSSTNLLIKSDQEDYFSEQAPATKSSFSVGSAFSLSFISGPVRSSTHVVTSSPSSSVSSTGSKAPSPNRNGQGSQGSG